MTFIGPAYQLASLLQGSRWATSHVVHESTGTIVVARKGDAVVAVQVFAGAAADQLRQATALVEAILGNI